MACSRSRAAIIAAIALGSIAMGTRALRNFAAADGMSALSIWAIQRDNGGCVGNGGANNCSGIAQATWAFSNILKTFTSP